MATTKFGIARISIAVAIAIAARTAIVVVIKVSIIDPANTVADPTKFVNFGMEFDGTTMVSTVACLITVKKQIAIEAS